MPNQHPLDAVKAMNPPRARGKACPSCGYDLSGHALSARCPECGWSQSDRRFEVTGTMITLAPDRLRQARIGVLCLTLGMIALAWSLVLLWLVVPFNFALLALSASLIASLVYYRGIWAYTSGEDWRFERNKAASLWILATRGTQALFALGLLTAMLRFALVTANGTQPQLKIDPVLLYLARGMLVVAALSLPIVFMRMPEFAAWVGEDEHEDRYFFSWLWLFVAVICFAIAWAWGRALIATGRKDLMIVCTLFVPISFVGFWKFHAHMLSIARMAWWTVENKQESHDAELRRLHAIAKRVEDAQIKPHVKSQVGPQTTPKAQARP